jgi:putative flippase GtrA
VPATSSSDPGRGHGLRARLAALVRELGKFGTVGGIAFLIDSVFYNVLWHEGLETHVAKTISTVVAATVAFLGNRFWTWRHREHDNVARQYTLFFGFNAVGLAISLSCLTISHDVLGHFWPALRSQLADNVSGLLIGTALGTLFRFWSYRRFVFRDVAVEPASLGEAVAEASHAEHEASPDVVPRM